MNSRQLLMRLRPEHETLLEILLDGERNHVGEWRRWQKETDIEHLPQGVYDLLPMLYKTLNSRIPDDPWMARLRGVYKRTWTSNVLTFRTALTAVRMFEAAGIPAMFIKGMGLLPFYEGDPGLRPMADADLLVCPDDLKCAVDALFAEGWVPLPGCHRDQIVGSVYRRLHAWSFVKNRKDVDLHWTWIQRDLGSHTDPSIWNRARSESILGQQVSVPAPADSLLLALVHGARALSEGRVLWIVDAAQLIRHGMNESEWTCFVRKSCSLDFQTLAGDMLGFLARRYELPVPEIVHDALRPGRRAALQRLEYRVLLGQSSQKRSASRWATSYLAYRRGQVDQTGFAGLRWLRGKASSMLGLVPGQEPASYPLRRLLNRSDLIAGWLHRHKPGFMKPPVLDRGVADCPVGRSISFAKNGMGHWYAISGWGLQEDTHLWSNGYQARLALRPLNADGARLRIELDMTPYLPPFRRRAKVDVSINGKPTRRLRYRRGAMNACSAFYLDPEDRLPGGIVDIVITPVTPRRPSREENSHDDRLLGVRLESMQLVKVPRADSSGGSLAGTTRA